MSDRELCEVLPPGICAGPQIWPYENREDQEEREADDREVDHGP